MAKEHLLWRWMAKEAKDIAGLHMNRVENTLQEGYPDVQLCYRGGYADVELKGTLTPKTLETPVDVSFRPNQIPWLMQRQAAGGNAWCLLQVYQTGIYLLSPDCLFEVRKGVTVTRLQAMSPLAKNADFRDFLWYMTAYPDPLPERHDDDAWKRRRIDCLRTLCAGA